MSCADLSGDDFFDRWQDDGDRCFAILQDGFEVPPSLEVFEHGLEERRTRLPLPIGWYANSLVEDPGVDAALVERVVLAFRAQLDGLAA